ncbi:MAG: cytochrome c-type biogenesis protein [Candidatus Methanocomedens sp.]|nr:MAG: cytochrome c-type biogenesis protein [ANME-2 cluster archaeon]
MSLLFQIENTLASIDVPLPFLAFIAGIISILSPCILPLLPAVMAYSTGKGKFRPVAIVAGLALTFSLLGMTMAAFNQLFFSYQQYIKFGAEVIIILLGIAMLTEYTPAILNSIPGMINVDPQKEGIAGGLLLGMSLGIVWIPCTGPILATIMMGVLLKGGIMYGGFLLFVYSMGLGIPMLLIAYFINVSGKKLSTVSRYDMMIKRGAGALLILVGLWLVYYNHIGPYLELI